MVTDVTEKPEIHLVHFDNARRELTLARNIDEVKNIRDQAIAVKTYLKQQKASLGMQNYCVDIKCRAERRMGEMLREMEMNEGGRPEENPLHNERGLPTLKDLGISYSQSHRWQLEASVPEDIYESYINGCNEKEQEATSSGIIHIAKKLIRDEAINNCESFVPEMVYDAFINESDYKEWLPKQHKCDLLLTDPPYATDIDDIDAFAQDWLSLALYKVKPTGRAYIFIGAYPHELRAYLNITPPLHMLLSNVLVWTYRNTLGPTPSHDYKLNWQAVLYYKGIESPNLNCPIMVEQFSVQDINAPDARHEHRHHKWEKPMEIAERFIRHSTQEDDIILDPFAGTGTFLLAATKLGRCAYGCDNSEEMVDIAVKRGCVRNGADSQ